MKQKHVTQKSNVFFVELLLMKKSFSNGAYYKKLVRQQSKT